jgi:hypothetical protein
MADVAQIIYEHTNGNTHSIFTDTFKIIYTRPTLKFFYRPDGTIYTHDAGVSQRIFKCTGTIAGTDIVDGGQDWNTWLTSAITYDATYPRLTTINMTSAKTITNVKVAVTQFEVDDLGDGTWAVTATFTERTL